MRSCKAFGAMDKNDMIIYRERDTTHKRFKIELMNCFLNELTKKTCIKSKIDYTKPQAIPCGFIVCSKGAKKGQKCRKPL